MGILWRQENYKKLTDVPFIFCSFRNNQWTSLGYTWIISVICFGSKILRENSIKWKKKKRNIISGHSISVTKADDSGTQIMNSFGLWPISFGLPYLEVLQESRFWRFMEFHKLTLNALFGTLEWHLIGNVKCYLSGEK